MSDILYGKVRIYTNAGQTITITTSTGQSRTITTTGQDYTDVMLAGLEEYTLRKGASSKSVLLNIGDFIEVELWDSTTMANNTWTQIQQRIVAGTLPSSFVGQTKSITMNGKTYHMQLARINDGTGTASTYYPKYTADFISVESMPISRKMNSTATNVGGWKNSELRTYLTNTVYPALPEDLKAVIINKTHMYTKGNQSTSFESVTDKLWLPTEWECFGSATYGGESAIYNVHYSAIFPDDTSRQKIQIGNRNASVWWTSSPHMSNATNFCLVSYDGSVIGSYSAVSTGGVVLGLRIG